MSRRRRAGDGTGMGAGATFWGRYRELLAVAVVLSVSLVVVTAGGGRRRDHGWLDRVADLGVAPVQLAVARVADGASGLWRGYLHLVGVRAENVRLRAENASLRTLLVAREEQRLENERLRQLVARDQALPEADMAFAEIIATSPTPLFRSVRIDRGRRHGIEVGAAVVGASGVVGRVAALGHSWAEVMLLVDASHSMDVVVQRSRARARLRGTGEDARLAAETQYLPRTADVVPGDLIVTSGLGGTFPKGLPVGTVTGCERPAFGLFQRVQVAPAVDFTRLEALMVIRARQGGAPAQLAGPAVPPEAPALP